MEKNWKLEEKNSKTKKYEKNIEKKSYKNHSFLKNHETFLIAK